MDNILGLFTDVNIWKIAKIFVLLGLGVYVIFAFIVVRQVKIMTQVVSGMLTGFLRFMSWIFFLFSIAVWIFIFLIL